MAVKFSRILASILMNLIQVLNFDLLAKSDG